MLRGRGDVVLYGSGTSAGKYFYRELIPGTKNYKTRRIDNVSSMDEAVESAMEIAFELNKEPDIQLIAEDKVKGYKSSIVVNRRKRAKPISVTVNDWLRNEQERVDKGLISPGTWRNKKMCLVDEMIPYLESKGITMTSELNLNSFDRYELYRSDTTPLMRQREVSIIKEYLTSHLVRERLLAAEIANDKAVLPRIIVKETDRMKNPAINPKDWKLIIDYVRDKWCYFKRPDGSWMVEPEHHRKDGMYSRIILWHYLLFLHNTGMSPEEVRRLKWKQIETVDVGRTNSKGEREEWLVTYVRTIRSKTKQAREIPCNQGRELRRLLKIQKDWIDKYGLTTQITPDTLVFGNIFRGMKPYDGKYLYDKWREVYLALKDQLTGHRFSPHDYTLYSLRSSFIENHLRNGTDIFLLARIAGHDVKELMKSYERLDVRDRASEVTIDTSRFGTKKTKDNVVNLLDE